MTDEIQNIIMLSSDEVIDLLNLYLLKNAKNNNPFISLKSKITKSRKYVKANLKSHCIFIPSLVAVYQSGESEVTMNQALEIISEILQTDGYTFDNIEMFYGLIDKRDGKYLEVVKDEENQTGYILINSERKDSEENFNVYIKSVTMKTTIKENKPYRIKK